MAQSTRQTSILLDELHNLRQHTHCLQLLRLLLDTEAEATERKELLNQLQIIISHIKNSLNKIDPQGNNEKRKNKKSSYLTKSVVKNEDKFTKSIINQSNGLDKIQFSDEIPIEQNILNDFTISIIDDDTILRSSTRKLLEKLGWSVAEFHSAEIFLNSNYYDKKGCLLIDEQLPKMSGNKLISNLRKAGCKIPCIMITGEGNIQLAVDTMKAGANDFLEKPLDINVLHQKLVNFLNSYNKLADHTQKKENNTEKFKLTKRENEILEQIFSGHSNKVIARNIGLSHRTIENHRSSIMKKTRSNSIMDLVRNALIK